MAIVDGNYIGNIYVTVISNIFYRYSHDRIWLDDSYVIVDQHDPRGVLYHDDLSN